MARQKKTQVAGAAEPKVRTRVFEPLDLSAEIANQSDVIRAAIENGDLIPKIEEVEKTIEKVTYFKDYLKLIPVTAQGCMVLVGGVESSYKTDEKSGEGYFDGPSLCKDFHYGNDLGTKSKESQSIARKVEGPDKAKAAAAKNLMIVFGISEAEALRKIEAMA